MSALWRWLIRGLVTVTVIGAVAVGVVYWLAARSIADTSGIVRVTGVDTDVEIIRDAYGVPRILAKSENDGLFALGYVHASDRLWQMDGSAHAHWRPIG